MPLHKKRTTTPRSTKSPKATPRRRAKTQALAVSDAVRREPIGRAGLVNPLAVLEPLQRLVIDRQMALLDAAMAWSPAHMIIHQQAAFWDGFAGSAGPGPAKRKAAPKRAKSRRANGR